MGIPFNKHPQARDKVQSDSKKNKTKTKTKTELYITIYYPSSSLSTPLSALCGAL